MPRWLSRLLWMIAQAAAIGGGMYLSFWSSEAPQHPVPPQGYLIALFCWVCVTAFATAVITRVWDRSVLAVSRLRTRVSQRQESGGEELSVGRPFAGTEQRAEVGQRRRIG